MPASFPRRQMNPGDAPTRRPERPQVSQGLGIGQDAEGIRLTGDRQVLLAVRGDLKEQAGIRATLVKLPCGV